MQDRSNDGRLSPATSLVLSGAGGRGVRAEKWRGREGRGRVNKQRHAYTSTVNCCACTHHGVTSMLTQLAQVLQTKGEINSGKMD